MSKVPRKRTHSMPPILRFIVLMFAWASVHGQAVGHRFPVFDATGFTQKPDLAQYGLRPITVVGSNLMWEGNKIPDTTSLPDNSRLSAFAQLANQSTGILVIDLEIWPLTGDPATVAESIRKYKTVIQGFKQPIPALRVGFYGVVPIRDYWDSLQPENSPRYLAWKKENDSLASIAQLVDAFFPSLYTFYEDPEGWSKYAIAQIQEARRYAGGKPVYVFLWPQYHGSNKKLGNTFLPAGFWRMELDTARKHADGVVLWCCPNRQQWDDKAPWWLETQGFLKEVDASRR